MKSFFLSSKSQYLLAIAVFLNPSLAWSQLTSPSDFKTSTDIYKSPSHIYKNPTKGPTTPVTCRDIASQQWNFSLESSPYCQEALRACIVVELIRKQLSSPIFTQRDVRQSDLTIAQDHMRQKLVACQLAIDTDNASMGSFSQFTGLR